MKVLIAITIQINQSRNPKRRWSMGIDWRNNLNNMRNEQEVTTIGPKWIPISQNTLTTTVRFRRDYKKVAHFLQTKRCVRKNWRANNDLHTEKRRWSSFESLIVRRERKSLRLRTFQWRQLLRVKRQYDHICITDESRLVLTARKCSGRIIGFAIADESNSNR